MDNYPFPGPGPPTERWTTSNRYIVRDVVEQNTQHDHTLTKSMVRAGGGAYFITEGYLEKMGLGRGGSWGSAGSNILISRCMRPIGFPFFTGSFGLNKI